MSAHTVNEGVDERLFELIEVGFEGTSYSSSSHLVIDGISSAAKLLNFNEKYGKHTVLVCTLGGLC